MIYLKINDNDYTTNSFINSFKEYDILTDTLSKDNLDHYKDMFLTSSLFNQVLYVLDVSSDLFKLANFDDFIFSLNNKVENNSVVLLFKNKTELKKYSKNITKFEVVEVKKDNLIDDLMSDFKISKRDLDYLLEVTNNDLYNLKNEFKKFYVLKEIGSTITKKDIDEVIFMHLETDLFKFISLIFDKNKLGVINMYENEIKYKTEPIMLISMLYNQFKFALKVKILSNLSDKDIADKLSAHPYRVKKTKEKLFNFSTNELYNVMDSLINLDYNIKTGITDKDLGFEVNLLEILYK